MAKKKNKKTKSSSGGISTKTMLIGGAVLLGIYAMSSSSTTNNGGGGTTPDPCTAYYNVNGNRVCETLLPGLGYIYWKGSTHGDGWYSYSQFPVKFGMSAAAWQTLIRTNAEATINPSNQNYTNAQNSLRTYYSSTLGPLQKVTT